LRFRFHQIQHQGKTHMRKLTFLIALASIIFVNLSTGSSPTRAGCFINGGILCPSTSAGGGFSGPVDAVGSAKEVWAFRCASAALATGTTKVANIIRASDSTATDIVCLTSGAFDTATASTFCASTTCKVAILYGQLGFANMTQATSANQPALTFNALGTKTCMTFAGSQFLSSGTTSTQAQPWTVSVVAERTGAFTSFDTIFESATNDAGAIFSNAANTAAVFGGTVLNATASDSAFHAMQFVANGASSSVYVDGTTTNGNAGASAFSGTLRMGTGITNLTGAICEVDLYYLGFTSGQAGAMNSNQHGTNGYNF
jgi:hypothetical protein